MIKEIIKKVIIELDWLFIFLKLTTPKINKMAEPEAKISQAAPKLIKNKEKSKVSPKIAKIILRNLLTEKNKGKNKISKRERKTAREFVLPMVLKEESWAKSKGKINFPKS